MKTSKCRDQKKRRVTGSTITLPQGIDNTTFTHSHGRGKCCPAACSKLPRYAVRKRCTLPLLSSPLHDPQNPSVPSSTRNAFNYAVFIMDINCANSTRINENDLSLLRQGIVCRPVAPKDNPRNHFKSPRSHAHRNIRSVSSRKQLLPHRAKVITSSAMLLCRGLSAHPAQMIAHLVHRLLELPAGLLVVFYELLIPSAVLDVDTTSPLRSFLNDQRPCLGDLVICILLVQSMLKGTPIWEVVNEFGGAVEEGERLRSLCFVGWQKVWSEVGESFE